MNPGQVFWVDGTRHSWELLAGERKPNDAATADPEAHHVLFENPHVRVFEGRTSHGRTSPMHSHPPSLYVSLDWMRLKLAAVDGKTLIHDFNPGQVLWFGDGGEHSWQALAPAAGGSSPSR